MQQAQGKRVLLRGVNVNYVEAGEGPAILLLHGLGTSLVTWSRNIAPLVEAGFKVLALDLPGCGDSDKPKYLSYDPVAGAWLIQQFISALGVERLSLVGNSAGGLIVSLFALSYPEKVDRLVLVGSGGLGYRVSWFLRIASLPVLGDLIYHPVCSMATAWSSGSFTAPLPSCPRSCRRCNEYGSSRAPGGRPCSRSAPASTCWVCAETGTFCTDCSGRRCR